MDSLDGAVALVTGGASGIGLATVRRLAALGARVVVADVDEQGGEAAAAEVGGRYVDCDVRDPAAHERAIALAQQTYGGLDVIHLNAGLASGTDQLDRLTVDRYRLVVGVNLDGVVFGVRAVLPALRQRGGGSIVATASLSGLTDYPGDPIYAATKHAVVGLVRALAATLAPDRIQINCVCPGFVDTPLLAGHVEQFTAAGYPLLSADDVADAVVAAVTSRGSGQAWVVQPGRPAAPYEFRGVPGPRGVGAGHRPPNPRHDTDVDPMAPDPAEGLR